MSDLTRQPGEPPTPPPSQPPFESDEPGGDSTLLWFAYLARVLVFFVYVVVLSVLLMLTLGFVLRLFGASTDAAFTRWVFRNDERIMEPFRGMFPAERVTDNSVVDFSLLFGMIFYAIIAIILHVVIAWLARQISRMARGQRPWYLP